jgi:hypothetical protein
MNSPKRQLVIVRFRHSLPTAADTFAKSAIKGSANGDFYWSFDRHSLLEPLGRDRGERQISPTSEVWVNNARLASSQNRSAQDLCGNRFAATITGAHGGLRAHILGSRSTATDRDSAEVPQA